MATALVVVLMVAVIGGSDAAWCVCKSDKSSSTLQKTLDYACGAGADCNPILRNGACYNPDTVLAHCSYAVNSYYQRKGQAQQACDFSGTATLTSTDPSTSGCTYPTSNRDLSPLGTRSISTQVVRNRMKSVKNIQKITKAMKMVAASKLRAVQSKTENSRGLWQPFTALLGDTPSVDVKKNVIVTITSDKGLCGGINSTSVKISKSLYKLTSGPEKETKYVLLGEKGKVQMVRDSKNSIEMTITEVQKNPINYTQVSVLADDILKNVEYDALRIIFNKFHSVVSFIPTVSTILSPEVVERESESGGKLSDLDSYEIEGGETKAEVLQNLSEFQFSCVLYNAVLENACSELGARMSAMDSSSRNAGEMLDRLTLTYNRTRQASITTELIEIISGASALTG
ncbi:ATP synthase subunit gamma, mitochondrial [Cocos nucifera]|uniref:ATP synthase subunit gamma, mitochondrial n=1 Tax=Cocos nucifera TaxID=13894 RepID=A0A8K0IXG3_COCNU|nr:ATP synthase subunit gamma, mitochondrial [Cocos nucifera]